MALNVANDNENGLDIEKGEVGIQIQDISIVRTIGTGMDDI